MILSESEVVEKQEERKEEGDSRKRQRSADKGGVGHRREEDDPKLAPRPQHLDTRPASFFHEAARGPVDAFEVPDWFLIELTKVARSETVIPKRSPIVFENNQVAAAENGKILESVGYDMERLIARYSDTTLGYGSEFREVSQLEPLIGRHPHFKNLK